MLTKPFYISRVVAYCTAEGYDQKRLSAYLKANHGVHPRLYDEALYVAYHFPLIPGKTSKMMSAPPIRSPGGGSILDKQLEQYEDNTAEDYSRSLEREDNEERFRRSASGHDLTNEEYHQHLQDQDDIINSGSNSIGRNGSSSKKLKNRRRASSRSSRHMEDEDAGLAMSGHDVDVDRMPDSSAARDHHDYFEDGAQGQSTALKDSEEENTGSAGTLMTPTPVAPPFMGGEVFFFDYGVTVFWNMTVEQEAWILDDLAQFEIKRLMPDDVQTEEFHFEYAGYSTPRIYNDM